MNFLSASLLLAEGIERTVDWLSKWNSSKPPQFMKMNKLCNISLKLILILYENVPGRKSGQDGASSSEDLNEAITYSVYGAPPPPRLIVDEFISSNEGCPFCPDCAAGHECAPSNHTRQQHRVLIQQLNNNKGELWHLCLMAITRCVPLITSTLVD